MLYKGLDTLPYWKDFAPIVKSLGYDLLSIKVTKTGTQANINAVIVHGNCDISLNDCQKVHGALQEVAKTIFTEGFNMELSSPGIERNIKNAAEFAFFVNRTVRILTESDRDLTLWQSGVIKKVSGDSLLLSKENGEESSILYSDIAKAKLVL